MTSAVAPNPVDPLYVDLDGTLVATDTLWESICLLVRRHPWSALRTLGWLLSGRAALKAGVASRVAPDASLLPYRPEILARLQAEKAAGRRIVLATAAHERTAQAVASHLGLFDDVLATTPTTNLKGESKLSAIREHAAGGRFGYVGNSHADLPVWAGADWAWVVNPSPSLRRSLAATDTPTEVVGSELGAGPGPALRVLRPHQWSKNALLFVPLILGQQITDLARLSAVLIGFVAFCAVASAGYLINDLLDIEADRRHPGKKKRPFAAGELAIPQGLLGVVALLGLGATLAFGFVSAGFGSMLCVYFLASLSYSVLLKERLFLDVVLLAGLYTLRVLAGGVAADVLVSTWLLAFSVFFFLGLALLKRYVELLGGSGTHESPRALSRRAYQTGDTGLVETMGIASGYLSVLVLCLYISRDDVTRFYSSPHLLWLVMPVMLYWISRMWLLARRGEVSTDPVLFALRDRFSYGVGACVAAIGFAAAILEM